MNISDAMLMAYADGELDETTHAQIARAIDVDPTLAKKVERHRALRSRLGSAYSSVLMEPMPARLSAAMGVTSPAPVADLAQVRAQKAAKRFGTMNWLAIAASAVFGILIGFLTFGGRDRQEVAEEGVIAKGALARALTNELASAPREASPVRIGVSYESNSGGYCRTFITTDGTHVAGVACRSQNPRVDEWRIRMLIPAEPASNATYRTAASGIPAALVELVQRDIKGESFDAERESRAIASGWKSP